MVPAVELSAIRAGTISGSGTISANGADGKDAENDGGGGGGAGGSVLVVANSGGLGSLSINARGGQGADAWPSQTAGGTPGNRHGPGGGGGGGFIAINGSASTNVTGGTNGTTTTSSDGIRSNVSVRTEMFCRFFRQTFPAQVQARSAFRADYFEEHEHCHCLPIPLRERLPPTP